MKINALLDFLAKLGHDVPVVVHLNGGKEFAGVALFPSADITGVTPEGTFVLSRDFTLKNDVLIDIDSIIAIELDR